MAAIFATIPQLLPAAEQVNPVHQQLDELAKLAAGKRLGVLTNGSARDIGGHHDMDYLLSTHETTITAFFGPEHGFRGDAADGHKMGDFVDPATSVPVYSLYGTRKAPTDEQLQNVDLFVFDIPDIGARFYTYIWTMTHAMESCAKNGKPFVVIDRPNPINGVQVEGAVNTTDLGLVGRLTTGTRFGIATRHGLTVGELATVFNETQMKQKVDLHVIRTTGWRRGQWWDETGRPFIPPSPNMRTLAAATVYPGTCIFEGSNLSEGRGTSTPFEIMGAPFIDGTKWADALNAKKLSGVKFEPVRFTPESRRFAHTECGGVRIIVTDRNTFQPVRTGMHMMQTVKKLYPEQVKITSYAGTLMATPGLAERLVNEDADAIIKGWQPGLEEFKKMREKYLLYRE
jgi:uncharacterized protein YbbC (DUF1343 family)